MTIDEILTTTPYVEDKKTTQLLADLAHVKSTGYLNRDELLEILKWKSPRPLKHYQLNSVKEVKEITKLAFSTKNDCLRLHLLTALTGVNYPSASAILMFYDPKKFPVLDIRVWKQLYRMNLVNVNSRGQNFTFRQCETYLNVIRGLGKEYRLSARQVEKRLFDYDKLIQEGNLYR